ncbi:hypothetical protein A3H78_01085 [Candidatus Roizmanbacteria bacterium RIFCSPLOWO2_02_FULL_36_11]|uniref:Transcriptional repressor PaaX-like central Cas2-like domain-containing protein n=1 Tax=Candidatus Roizmanbacteria bacterium RIFCSPLOWO2_02_FULL_36_11 TaxID=1802071 RepID=A0A1F7JIK5_9BACT|nr:MAG: hypothetical protein A3H78_01085 [Candidatus Roizmanbacteria bacterium RIFCSPLOWO2_02_FULL_36_11]
MLFEINKHQKKEISTSSPSKQAVEQLALSMCQKFVNKKDHSSTEMILNLIGSGLLSLTKWYPSNLTNWASPYLRDPEADHFTKRFNIPYLKRTIHRLEKQKLITIEERDGKQIVKITDSGATRILKASLSKITVEKPKKWDGTWWLISYDLPEKLSNYRHLIRRFFLSWGFYPLHKSVYLHAYPCTREVEMLREYYGLGEHIRIFTVSQIENAKPFRDFFGI